MAVFTALTRDEIVVLLGGYSIGELVGFEGIPSGIENTNFFVSTTRGEFVLTVFERLGAAQLPFYLGLMKHLAVRGLPVPEPAATAEGSLISQARRKPVAIVTRLPGRAVLTPTAAQCAQVGHFLADLHQQGRDFAPFQPNLRGIGWWKSTLPKLEPLIAADQFQELAEEVVFQDSFVRSPQFERLPAGPVHADLFRDNVLFDGGHIGGVIDFYFAACTAWLFDLAVTINDWCVDPVSGEFDRPRALATLKAYHAVRPLTDEEHKVWRTALRAAALRFWISRLYDLHLPRPAALLKPHDPARFERMLRLRARQPDLPWVS
jgi:homoserine kinase type II